ncbi:MAG: DUF4954 family protein [Calditrichaceae bacterium]
MDNISIHSTEALGKNFIPQKYLKEGSNEYYFRNKQTFWSQNHWRKLKSDEIDLLVVNGNWAEDWNSILIATEFEFSQIINNKFYGLVRIGRVKNQCLEHEGLKLPIGISNSLIISSDIGDDSAIHNVDYLAHYIVGDRCILFNIDEMYTTDTAKFGNGIVKEGEPEDKRIWIALMNEAGGRSILPFDGINTADAYLWAKYRDDKKLQDSLLSITQNQNDAHRGYYLV